MFRALYTFRDETEESTLMLGSHVDDLFGHATANTNTSSTTSSNTFSVEKSSRRNFGIVEEEVAQDDDFTIHVTMRRLDKEAQEDRHSKGTKVM